MSFDIVCHTLSQPGRDWPNHVNRRISLIMSYHMSYHMSYQVLLQISSWAEAKTASPKRHEIPSLHFEGFQDLNRLGVTSCHIMLNHACESLVNASRFYLDVSEP